MPAGLRLTSCAASDHPNPAVAVGEIVGHLQNSLAGSPQFALVLVDERIGSRLKTIAGAVHQLLGPDLLLAAVGPHVAGADSLAVSRGSVVVWAVSAVDVIPLGDDHHGGEPTRSADSTILTMAERADGAVAVALRAGPDTPRPTFISGDGRLWRPTEAGILFPAESSSVIQEGGHREIGPAMTVTEAVDRTLRRLDHVPARAVLVDQLETTDAFIDGPSVEFPPLRIVVSSSTGREGEGAHIDVLTVDPEDGSLELAAPVGVGDRVQLIADDPDVATRGIVARILNTWPGHHLAVLVGCDLSSPLRDFPEAAATAAIHTAPQGLTTAVGGRRPWSEIMALVLHISDDD